jgi:hypothetical protein
MSDKKERDFFAAALRAWNVANRVLGFYGCAAEEKVLEFENVRLRLMEICRRGSRGSDGIDHLQKVGETTEHLRGLKDRIRVQELSSGKRSAIMFEQWVASIFPEAYGWQKSKPEWN